MSDIMENFALKSKLLQLELKLDEIAKEAYELGFRVVVNTHNGVIDYYNPKYPKNISNFRLEPVKKKKY